MKWEEWKGLLELGKDKWKCIWEFEKLGSHSVTQARA